MAIVAGSIPAAVRLRLELQTGDGEYIEVGYIGAEITLPLVVGDDPNGPPGGNIRFDSDEFSARLQAATLALTAPRSADDV